MRPLLLFAVVLIAQTMAGCSGSSSTRTVAAECHGGAADHNSQIDTDYFSAISPDAGSIYGGGRVNVFGDIDRPCDRHGWERSRWGWVGAPEDLTRHVLYAPPHAVGRVDLVVTNPDGGSAAAAYTYVDPGSFDLNGACAGFTVDGSDTWIEFTVRDQLLTNLPGIDPFDNLVEIELSAPVLNGKVEFVGDAVRFSAWVASASDAAGTIDMTRCRVLRICAGCRYRGVFDRSPLDFLLLETQSTGRYSPWKRCANGNEELQAAHTSASVLAASFLRRAIRRLPRWQGRAGRRRSRDRRGSEGGIRRHLDSRKWQGILGCSPRQTAPRYESGTTHGDQSSSMHATNQLPRGSPAPRPAATRPSSATARRALRFP